MPPRWISGPPVPTQWLQRLLQYLRGSCHSPAQNPPGDSHITRVNLRVLTVACEALLAPQTSPLCSCLPGLPTNPWVLQQIVLVPSCSLYMLTQPLSLACPGSLPSPGMPPPLILLYFSFKALVPTQKPLYTWVGCTSQSIAAEMGRLTGKPLWVLCLERRE